MTREEAVSMLRAVWTGTRCMTSAEYIALAPLTLEGETTLQTVARLAGVPWVGELIAAHPFDHELARHVMLDVEDALRRERDALRRERES